MRLMRLLFVVGCLLSAQACSPAGTAQPTTAPSTEPAAVTPAPIPTGLPPTVTPLVEQRTPTSIEEIAGIWDSRMLSERGYQEFKLDGTMNLGYTIDQLHSNPVFSEPVPFWFEGEVLHIQDSCGHGTYRLTLYRENGENKKLVFDVIEDPCEQRIADWKVPMRWVGP